MTLHVHDPISGQKLRFEPVRPGRVGLYVCGLTVQDRPHVGHMYTFVACDLVRRYLEYLGLAVTHVQNFTDIDDKIIARARAEGVAPAEVAERNIAAYHAAAERLGLLPAHHYPRVTEHIPEIVEHVRCLLERGHAYAAQGDVYFDVRSWPEYGLLSGRHPDDLRAGVRVAVGERKRDPLDFALWKAAAPDEPGWDSPWGRGRPGWHIECSAMAIRYLGEQFDLHGGGGDLLFPHHENERAQGCACTGRRYVNHWLHTGLLLVDERKMSKSRGNFFTVDDVLARVPAEVVRFFLLSAHFRSSLRFSEERLEETAAAYRRLRRDLGRLVAACALAGGGARDGDAGVAPAPSGPLPVPRGLVSLAGEALARAVRKRQRAFFAALDDDFNSGGAVGALFALASDLRHYLDASGGRYLDPDPLAGAYRLCADADRILGLFPGGLEALRPVAPPADVEELARERHAARQSGDLARADALRERIRRAQWEIDDTPGGWRLRPKEGTDAG
ncbi:MAG: cysteine--tRNA ligase [Candidatus Krumholzibacteriia bacterium]